jgi:hypothetical protein
VFHLQLSASSIIGRIGEAGEHAVHSGLEREKTMILLYDPTAPRQADARQDQRKLATLSGKVVGFIDNAKPNFEFLVDDLADLLVANHGVSRVVKRRKSSASIPASEAVVSELARQCDLVITGSGD